MVKACYTCKYNQEGFLCPPDRDGKGYCQFSNNFYKWKPIRKNLFELEIWHKEFPHLKSYIKEVMRGV